MTLRVDKQISRHPTLQPALELCGSLPVPQHSPAATPSGLKPLVSAVSFNRECAQRKAATQLLPQTQVPTFSANTRSAISVDSPMRCVTPALWDAAA